MYPFCYPRPDKPKEGQRLSKCVDSKTDKKLKCKYQNVKSMNYYFNNSKLLSKMSITKKSLELKFGQSITFDEVIIQFHTFGYERVEHPESFGQFSVGGGLIKIFSSAALDPLTIDFFGNRIDKIYLYDFATNKKIKQINNIEIPNNIIKVNGELITYGNLVVHINHGIGIYRGKILKKINNKIKEFIALEYANGDCLYLPLNIIDKISKYLGVSRRKPKLSRLGSTIWEKAKKKVEQSIWVLAKELLEVYAKREIVTRQKYNIDREWDKKLKSTFIHIETPDQEKSLEEIYSDLERGMPMDRLLVGDVGFGKTEIAVRTAAQVISNGMQVAILAPTTILSRQHFMTISVRLKEFPIRIAELSRFINQQKQEKIIEDLKSGKIDLIIGTHRILKHDVNFKNLGLLIIDEEQRFGVKDKEKLKGLKNDIDILSLSATPIPRSLFIALSGIRQISIIKTPPAGRKSIETKVEKYDEEKVKEYISSELERDGQIYFLHNDIKTIEARAKEFERYFPKAKIAIGHGQLSEEKLATTMAEFAAGKIDILFCSTIIENGLDIPTVNTLIVENADNFGLAQLYQIRGRTGRGKNQAFAYFTFRKNLVGNAYKRLQALVEKTDLGSGFDIAYSDLEIRGGGNILGRQQHGNMEELGLILYTKLLNQAVEKLKC